MKNYKIYISKSKQSDFNQLLKLKSDLSKFKNIEVLEFQGGTYNTNLLLSADLVIFIPPKNSTLDDQAIKEYQIEVGRGQYEEFVNANLINNKAIPCELYYDNQFYTILDCDTYMEEDQTWQEWGLLFTSDYEDGYGLCLKDILELNLDGFNIKQFNNLKSFNNLKKLLIKEYGRN